MCQTIYLLHAHGVNARLLEFYLIVTLIRKIVSSEKINKIEKYENFNYFIYSEYNELPFDKT